MMTFGCAPVVTDVDREWALAQCPAWAVRRVEVTNDDADPDEGEIVDEPYRRKPNQPTPLVWDDFVSEQIERFERYFGDQRKPRDDWSALWRKGWWPKADPRIAHSRKVPPMAGQYPTFRKGTAEFEAALRLASKVERAVMLKVGLVMYRPDDPRVAKIKQMTAHEGQLTPRSRAMQGETT